MRRVSCPKAATEPARRHAERHTLRQRARNAVLSRYKEVIPRSGKQLEFYRTSPTRAGIQVSLWSFPSARVTAPEHCRHLQETDPPQMASMDVAGQTASVEDENGCYLFFSIAAGVALLNTSWPGVPALIHTACPGWISGGSVWYPLPGTYPKIATTVPGGSCSMLSVKRG